MALAQEFLDDQRHQTWSLGDRGAIAVVSSEATEGNVPLLRREAEGNLLVVTGVPIALTGDLDNRLEQIVDSNYEDAGRLLSELEGVFAGVFWDQSAGKLVVVTDILGMQPLYMARPEDALLLSTEVKGLAASGLVDIEPEPASWGSLLMFGHSLENNTSLKNAKLVDAGAVTVFCPMTRQIKKREYWRWPQLQPQLRFEDIDIAGIVDILEREIKAYLVHQQPGTVLMSGGLDNRLILGLLDKMGIKVSGIVLNHEDEHFGIDGVYAAKVARRLGVPLERYPNDENYFSSSHYFDYLEMNEAATTSLYVFISQVSRFLHTSQKAFWEGVFPGAVLTQLADRMDIYLSLKTNLVDENVWKAVNSVFAGELAGQVRASFEEQHEKEMRRYDRENDGGFGKLEFTTREPTRHRYGPNPFKVFANRLLPFTPGSSKAFWDTAAAIPQVHKVDFKLYRAIYESCLPEMLDVPFCSGGHLLPGTRFSLWHSVLSRTEKLRNRRSFRRLTNKIFPKSAFNPSRFIKMVISQINPEHHNLNAEGVRRIQKSVDAGTQNQFYEVSLLFYWQVWRWIMEGKIRQVREEMRV